MASVDDQLAESATLLQKEELEALEAIYGEDFHLEDDNGEDAVYFRDTGESKQGMSSAMPTFSISIRPDNAETEILKTDLISPASLLKPEARLIISFQPGYPISCPPLYQLSIPWCRGGQKQLIADALEELYLEHLGESIVYIWVEKVRELLHEDASGLDVSVQNNTNVVNPSKGYNNAAGASSACTAVDSLPSKELIDHFSNSLSFNLAAGDGYMDYNDGNTASGDLYGGPSTQVDYNKSRQQQPISSGIPEIRTGAPLTDRKSTFQAHVAPVNDTSEIRLNVRNVIVVVSRWYGGIQLHGDRFKHINNVARQALVEFGFVSSTDGKKTDDSKSKKGSAKK